MSLLKCIVKSLSMMKISCIYNIWIDIKRFQHRSISLNLKKWSLAQSQFLTPTSLQPDGVDL